MPEATMQILVDAAIKGAAVLLMATAATALMRKTSAAKRHLVWVVAVSALLLIPVLSLVLPAWQVLPALQRSAKPVMMLDNVAPLNPPAAAREVATNVEMPTISSEPMQFEAAREPLSAASLIVWTWLGGALLVLATIMLGMARVWWLARHARQLPDSACAALVAALAREQGINVQLLEGDDFAMPMTWGVIHPTLLLPRSAHHWPAARLNAVVRHELAHIRRRDPLWQLLGEFACALHWYNPFAWYGAKRMRIEREHACDDAVLTAGSRAVEYAAELLDIARSLRAARATSVAAIAMARPRQLEGRLLAVLDDQRNRAEARRRWPVWVGGALLVLPLAALQPAREVAADIPTEASLRSRLDAVAKTTSKPQPKLPATTWQAPTRKPIQISGEPVLAKASILGGFSAVQQQNCLREEVRHISISSHSDDDFKRVKWETRNCSGTMEMYGKVRIAGDLSGFEYIPPDGKVVITSRDDDHKRELTLTPAGDRFAYAYEVDGNRRAWDNEGQAWLSSIVQLLVRRAGFGADERVDYLLKTGGLNAVLQEVAVMESDYVQRQYLTKTLGKTTLNGGAVESMLQVAGRELNSDYELTEFLIAVGRKYDFTPASRAAFIKAATTLDSDYEHRRALAAVLKKGGLSSDDVTAILTSAKEIKSDYEKAELLIGIAGRYQLDPKMRSAYLEATNNMSSDYEQKRVFETLLKQGGLSGSDLAYVLNATGSVRSDYERAQILKLIATNADFTQPQLQEAYLKAAAEIASDYELRQVLSSVLKRERLTAGALTVVLTAAETLDSDYERAELLIQVLRSYTLNAEQRNRVIKMTERMSSEYERGRVSSLLIKQLNAQ